MYILGLCVCVSVTKFSATKCNEVSRTMKKEMVNGLTSVLTYTLEVHRMIKEIMCEAIETMRNRGSRWCPSVIGYIYSFSNTFWENFI